MEKLTNAYGTSVVHTACEVAKIFRKRAYAPYSDYKVGACAVAIDPDSGTALYFGGCNVENASYGMTICAERAAIFNAVGNGFKNIPIMAIATKNNGMSCGACRQVEYEFNPDMIILSINEVGGIMECRLPDLMPNAFGPHKLNVCMEGMPEDKKDLQAQVDEYDEWLKGYRKWYDEAMTWTIWGSEPE